MKLIMRDRIRDKKIIEWRKQGLLYEDIAKRIGVTKSRVGQLYRRIKREGLIKGVAA